MNSATTADKSSGCLNSGWEYRVQYVLTWLFRLIAGGTFIFSGFVKAVDPWGTFYKFGEYTSALGISIVPALLLTAVAGLCVIEFATGISLLLGIYRKSALIVALLIMCVMLPLTLWIALFNPVTDCGCFGDFLIISNWSTFWKNVILTLVIIWLLKFNDKCRYLISPAFQWLALVFSALFILIISFVGYYDQPLLDFRPYAEGTALVTDSDVEADDADNFVFVYEKDGIKKEFGVDDDLPSESDGWKYVERHAKEKPASLSIESGSESKTLRIWNLQGDEDVTEEVIPQEGKALLLMIPDLGSVSPATTWKINALYDWAHSHSIDMIAVVSGSISEILEWKDLAMPEYPIYTSDDTAIKEVVRGNPAIVTLDNGIISRKIALSAIDIDKFTDKSESDTKSSPVGNSGLISNRKVFLHWVVYLYLIFMAVPVALSFLPGLYASFTRDGKARGEE